MSSYIQEYNVTQVVPLSQLGREIAQDESTVTEQVTEEVTEIRPGIQSGMNTIERKDSTSGPAQRKTNDIFCYVFYV